jgi:hypothetical protein
MPFRRRRKKKVEDENTKESSRKVIKEIILVIPDSKDPKGGVCDTNKSSYRRYKDEWT